MLPCLALRTGAPPKPPALPPLPPAQAPPRPLSPPTPSPPPLPPPLYEELFDRVIGGCRPFKLPPDAPEAEKMEAAVLTRCFYEWLWKFYDKTMDYILSALRDLTVTGLPDTIVFRSAGSAVLELFALKYFMHDSGKLPIAVKQVILIDPGVDKVKAGKVTAAIEEAIPSLKGKVAYFFGLRAYVDARNFLRVNETQTRWVMGIGSLNDGDAYITADSTVDRLRAFQRTSWSEGITPQLLEQARLTHYYDVTELRFLKAIVANGPSMAGLTPFVRAFHNVLLPDPHYMVIDRLLNNHIILEERDAVYVVNKQNFAMPDDDAEFPAAFLPAPASDDEEEEEERDGADGAEVARPPASHVPEPPGGSSSSGAEQ